MRWVSWRNSGLLAVGFAIGVAATLTAGPVWRGALRWMHESRYAELTFKCDSAMRNHYVAGMSVANNPSDVSVSALKSAEVALIDCQDYDLLQKRLLDWGLTETDLSIMRLESIEADAKGLLDVIETHEIRN